MKSQNIKKYQQKELNLMYKTDEKTRNYIISSMPRDKMHNRTRENWICDIVVRCSKRYMCFNQYDEMYNSNNRVWW